ncbi:MAG: sigma-70 family RNA polymerase sigma factor [Planctomycetes bacterium]|nr:sigma-70 family RNA polymerase sigma factor [Planctomycetota bacterium]
MDPEHPSRAEAHPLHTEELARALPGGGSHAFSELYARCAPAVHAWASLNVRDALRARLDPDDVVQEVAVRAMQNRASYDPDRAEFRAWLFGIARNVLYQALERLARGEPRRLPEGEISVELRSVVDTATGVTRRLRRDESYQRLLARLEALPDEERRMLLYRGLEGLPHDEVAKRLGLSPEAATKRWHRLREKLQQDAIVLELASA